MQESTVTSRSQMWLGKGAPFLTPLLQAGERVGPTFFSKAGRCALTFPRPLLDADAKVVFEKDMSFLDPLGNGTVVDPEGQDLGPEKIEIFRSS